jgi:hypothetical protein
MRSQGRLMTLPARRLILAYAALAALLDLSVLLPGNPYYSSAWGAVGTMVIQALVVWRLWHGSPLAWFFGVAAAVLSVLAVFLMVPGVEVGVILLCVFSISQAAVLCMRPLTAFVWSDPKKPVPSN